MAFQSGLSQIPTIFEAHVYDVNEKPYLPREENTDGM